MFSWSWLQARQPLALVRSRAAHVGARGNVAIIGHGDRLIAGAVDCHIGARGNVAVVAHSDPRIRGVGPQRGNALGTDESSSAAVPVVCARQIAGLQHGAVGEGRRGAQRRNGNEDGSE